MNEIGQPEKPETATEGRDVNQMTDSDVETNGEVNNEQPEAVTEETPVADTTPSAEVDTPQEAVEADPAAEVDTPQEAEEAEPAAEVDTPQEAEEAEPAAEVDDSIEATEATEDESIADEADEVEAADGNKPHFSRGDLIEGTIAKTSPLEVVVDLGEGVEGIIPGNELERMSRSMIEELKEGEPITVFVVNTRNQRDPQGRPLLSINRAQEELDWRSAEEYRQNQQPYEGNVAGYNKGGLIVRFGRLRGFVPQSQIGDERRRKVDGETPDDMFSNMVNDDIVVKVMEVDRSRNRLILSERAATREIREKRKSELIEELAVGQIREGRVVSLEDFGAFVDVGGAEGLVHLTEISWRHVTHPRDVLNVGQTVKVEVISVDPRRKRIGLSIKRQEADPWDEVATTYQVGDLVQGVITKLTKFGAFAQLIDAEEIEGLVHISELSDTRVQHPREVVQEGDKLTLRVVKIDVRNRRLGLSLKAVHSAEYLDRDLRTFASETDTDE